MSSLRFVISAQTFMQNVLNDDNFEIVTESHVCDRSDILIEIDNMMKADKNIAEIQPYYKDQVKEFEAGPHMTGVVQRVAAKLGIESKELNPEIITAMYEVSAYEYSIDQNRIPPWYKVFCPDDLEILEYAWDISWYYVIGYGNPYNAKLACPTAIRLEERFRNKISGEGPDGVFYFASEKNVLVMLIMLGLANGDAPFTASNYKCMKDLEWRTSLYGPFAANFIAVIIKSHFISTKN
ncbi:multiple inositol polyphosphate phosphatase 1-like [Adelges cooleyi]|uniref:multiple inositol polyphosphate phosphatase 1-like n=1 Tax=Adelges cooleyi TaxID=133065 RepID=UPI0021802067|nr:multiple inositol polyphosphate phosphatase 1-like [Adelges cooleyi]